MPAIAPGGGGNSPFPPALSGSPFAVTWNANPFAPNMNSSDANPNAGYPGIDARNQFIQSANPTPGSDAQVFPFYNQTLTGTTTGVPYFGASLTGYNQTAQGQQTGLTDALGGDSASAGDSFMQQAIAALNASGGGPSIGDLTTEANQEAALKYDPLIQQLQQNLSSAQTNEKNASGKIGDLYNSLGKALAAQMPVITNQFNAQEDQSKQNYANLQSQIQNNYQGAQQAQAAELQKLGIQAALPQSTQKMQQDQQYLQNQAGTNGQALNDAMRLMGQGQSDFAQRASMIAPMQGANIQSNLATQLQQLQDQINQQIAGYKGQEGAAASSLLQQLQSAAQKQQMANQQTNFDNIIKLANLEKTTHPGVFGVAPKAPTAAKYKGTSGVANYVQDNAATADPNEIMGDFQNYLNSPDLAKLVQGGNGIAPGLDAQWPVLQQFVTQNDPGISNDALNELYNVLSIKLGKFQ